MDLETLLLFPDNGDPNLQLADPSLVRFYRNLENRIYWIDKEIGDDLLDLIEYILMWNREDKDIPTEERKPIKLIINSPGGSLDISKSVIEIISISKTPIYTFALGTCASGASMIFLSGAKRYALPNTTFIFHKGGVSGMGGDFQQVQSFMKDYEQQINELIEYYKKKTSYPPELIEDKLNKGDWYVKANEALENGVINEVITDIDILL